MATDNGIRRAFYWGVFAVMAAALTAAADPSGPPVVDNGGGATLLGAGTALLNGSLTDDGGAATTVTVCWGPADGGTDRAAWAAAVTNAPAGVGAFSNTVSGLLYGVRYYYRCVAVNAAGESWAGSSASFVANVKASAAVGGLLVRTYDTTTGPAILDPVSTLMAVPPSGTATQTATLAHTSFTGGAFPGITANDNLALLWTGWFDAGRDGAGDYTFATSSDDGSVLYLDLNADGDFADTDELVVNNNYSQGETARTGTVALAAGPVRIAIGYFQGIGSLAMSARFRKGSRLPWTSLDPVNGTNGYFFPTDPAIGRVAISNLPATGRTTSSAVLNAALSANGAVYDVTAYWGTTAGPTNATEGWEHAVVAGRFTNASGTVVSVPVDGLATGQDCFFTFRATNEADDLWAGSVAGFRAAGPAVLNNEPGPTDVIAESATLRGTLLDDGGEPAAVRVYWGLTDGGTTAADWVHAESVPASGPGPLAVQVTGLEGELTYHYRYWASNSFGEAWAPTTLGFTTPKSRRLYVWQQGANVPPYTNWSMAATNVDIAVAFGNSQGALYDTVLVTNGNYAVMGTVVISNGLTVCGVNGPGATVVYRGASATACRVFQLSHALARLTGLTVSNGLYSRGCGVWMNAGTVSNCVITRNAARDGYNNNERTYGAGVYMEGGLLTHSTLVTNTLRGNHGGGAALYMKNAARTVLCRIDGNANDVWDQSEGGGALSLRDAAVLDGCLVVGNVNVSGPMGRGNSRAAVFIDSSGAGRVRGCTIVGNANGSGSVAGLAMNGGRVDNTIVWGNYATAFGYASVQMGNGDGGTWSITGNTSHACAPELTGGTGNVAADPELMDLAGGDYRPGAASPCLDRGILSAGMPAVDLAGNPRVANGLPDMGAFERDAAAGELACDFAGTPRVAFDSVTVSFTSGVSGTNTGIAWYGWDFGDGQTAGGPGLAAVANTYGAAGYYTVTLTVTNTDGAGAVRSKSQYVRVLPSTNYVATGTTPVWPYASWDTAATNIADAVRAAGAIGGVGTVVLVSNGSYSVSAELTLTNPIVLRGVNGPANTTIYRGATNTLQQYRVLRLISAAAVVEGFAITNGYASDLQGCGAYVQNGVLRNCEVRQNVVPSKAGPNNNQGAGVYVNGGLVEDCVIAGNSLTHEQASGAGAYVNAGTLRRCTISGNALSGTTAERGAGLSVNGGLVENCLVVSNLARGKTTSDEGAAVYISAGTLRNCTIAANVTSNHQFAGVYRTGGSVYNTVVSGNQGLRIGYLSADVNTTNGFTYSCARELTAGPGNIGAAAPLRADFSLTPAAPCIDAGTNYAGMAATDLAGASRVIGTNVDMGCFEFDAAAGPFECSFVVPVAVAFDRLEATFTAAVSGPNTNVTNYRWDFGDGVTEEGPDSRVVSHVFATPGSFTVSLTCLNDAGQTATADATITVYPSTNFVAPAGGHVWPYTSWATAATTVQAAVDAGWWNGSRGTTVRVAAGSYPLTNTLLVGGGMTLHAESGPLATTLYRSVTSQPYRVLWLANAQALVEGFSITNGSASELPGNGVYLDAGTLSNCVIRQNQCLAKGVQNNLRGVGLYMNGGTVEDCVIAENRLTHEQATAAGVYMNAGLLKRSRIEANVLSGITSEQGAGLYVNGGTVENCLIAGNVARGASTADAGGAVYVNGGTVRNCTVAGNVTTNHQVAGIYRAGGTVINTAVYGNRGVRGGYASVDVNTTNGFTYSCAPELTNGVGNLAVDPQLRNIAGGDFHPVASSPCLNAGTNYAGLAVLDLDGRARLQNRTVDIGCYEVPLVGGLMFLIP